jgi:hypothetical protein
VTATASSDDRLVTSKRLIRGSVNGTAAPSHDLSDAHESAQSCHKSSIDIGVVNFLRISTHFPISSTEQEQTCPGIGKTSIAYVGFHRLEAERGCPKWSSKYV